MTTGSPHHLDPTHATLPTGSDPADLYARHGKQALATTLDQARPLADTLIEERLTNLPTDQALAQATRVIAARPAQHWNQSSDTISARLNLPTNQVRRSLLAQIKTWNTDPRQAAGQSIQNLHQVKARLAAAGQSSPAHRWAHLANQLDPRLTSQGDWPATANLIQHAHDTGHDVATTARRLIADAPLNALPAQDLRYRLAGQLNLEQYPAGSETTPNPPDRTRPSEDRRNHPGIPNTSPGISR